MMKALTLLCFDADVFWDLSPKTVLFKKQIYHYSIKHTSPWSKYMHKAKANVVA